MTVRFNKVMPMDKITKLLVDLKKKTIKPIFAILSYEFSTEEVKLAEESVQKLHNGGVPAFLSIEGAAVALNNALNYYQYTNY